MLSSGWYSMQDFHKSWQSYTPVNRGTICVKVHPFRLLPIKGNNCSLIPEEVVINVKLGRVRNLTRSNRGLQS